MSKTNIGLMDFAKSKVGVNYVYGTKGEILTEERLNSLYKSYSLTDFPNDYYDRSKNFIGTWCTDCSGLISWYTGKVLSSAGLYSNAKEKKSIDTLG